MLNAWRSDAARAVLSTISKFCQMRPKYPMSSDMRYGSCCWMPPENSQFDGRCPQPVRTSGSYWTAAFVEPNDDCAIAPHVSTLPVVAGFCAPGSARLQSGTKFLLVSVHARVVVVCNVRIGFGLVPRPFSVWPSRYLLAAPRMAVLPSPRTSHTTPLR